VLETARLRLELWEPGDWRLFRPLATDPEMVRYISGGVPWTDEQTRRFAEKQSVQFAAGGYCRWKLVHKENGGFAGFCGLGMLDGFTEPEIGWWVARRYWGQGLATEAAMEALRDARERALVPPLISVAHQDNAASIRIMRKIGLHFDRALAYKGYPVVVYAL
jgi:RimJ/RimL family protein N-acetyltransferase